MKPLRVLILCLGLFLFAVVASARADQGPEVGGHELQIWNSGGYGIKGIEKHTGQWSAGVRYGWILTGPTGPGFLRGRLEYSVDLVPIFIIHQHVNTSYGAAVDPLNLKWNFDSPGRFVPYVELSGGTLFTNHQIPSGTSHVNFETAAGLGMHVLTGKFNWTADVRYMHISNGGLYPINPGINTLQVRLGFGLFTRGRS